MGTGREGLALGGHALIFLALDRRVCHRRGQVLTVDEDHIPLLHALLAENASKYFDLVKELFVRDPFLGLGDRAVV
jgi:hypothetical protein